MGSISSSGTIPPDLRAQYDKHGQGHVFKYADSEVIKGEQVNTLVAQLGEIDPAHINSLFESTMSAAAKEATAPEECPAGSEAQEMEPIESLVSVDSASAEDKERWYTAGLKAIADGKVAVVVLSGGQGTRLGFDGPKGMYNIGLPSQKTLFQLQAERLQRVCYLARELMPCPSLSPRHVDVAPAPADEANTNSGRLSIPWYIMTSPFNDAITRKFFADNNFFGVPEKDVFFFPQGTLPCMTPDGKMLLESAGRVAMAPDGNGGIYPALQRTGALDDMHRRGVEHVHVFSIDNALVRVADPHFLGYCIESRADCGNKSVWKSEPGEKVGVVVKRGGKPCVVEYSEMDTEACGRRDADGKLVFGAGNICNHYFSLAFLRDTVLPGMANMYHVAHKKIPAADGPTGETVKPTANNGIKLESFIFDVFPLSTNMVLFEAKREEEFAPVKNAPGTATDSPDSAREMISAQAKRWARAEGAQIVEGDGTGLCEVSPLVSYGGEDLKKRVGIKKLEVPFHLV